MSGTAGSTALSLSGSRNKPRRDRFSEQAPVPGATNHSDHGCCKDPHRARGILTAIGFATNGELDAAVIQLSCRRWSCVCCRHRLQARNRKRALMGASTRGLLVMLTLTLPAEFHPSSAECVLSPRLVAPEAGGRLLSGKQAVARVTVAVAAYRWKVLLLSLSRLFGTLPYYRAVELHASGVAHLHVLIRVSSRTELLLRQRAMAEAIEAAGFGRSSWSVADGPRAVAEYVTKATAAYVSKDAEAMPKWTRRGSWSKDWTDAWVPATPIAGFSWQLGRASERMTSEALRASGFRVVDPAMLRITVAGGPPVGGLLS